MFPFSSEDTGGFSRFLRIGGFVASAALAALLLRGAWNHPLVALALVTPLLIAIAWRWLSRRKTAQLLRSGDVDTMLEEYRGTFQRIPYAETMGPLMQATALAANGWVAEARNALAKAQRGPAWEAAIEHRLFLEALLLTFEGDRDGALEKAERLGQMPVPDGGAVAERVALLRLAIAAVARAFAHKAEPGDAELLTRASELSPLVYWAMRYAAAVIAVDQGQPTRARELIEHAPEWPRESTFRAFHQEILAAAA